MHIVFVTTELTPQLPGGAGSVVADLRRELLSRGDRITVLLVADTDAELPDGVVAIPGGEDAGTTSRAAAEGLRRLVKEDPPDLIEFQDFGGLAFDSLAHRQETGVARTPVQVRLHAPFDLIFDAIGVEPPWLPVVRSMERAAFQMADRVLVPTQGIGRLAATHYQIEPGRVLRAQPPAPAPRPLPLEPAPTPLIVVLGRLGEQKGSHDMVAAAGPMLRNHPDLRLVFIGEDGWSAAAERPMREWLVETAPDDVADRIEFTGRLEGVALDHRLAQAWAVVVPSRFESFSLAAHEARGAGLPLIVPDLAAFAGILDESTGALVYDGSREGLTAAVHTMIDDDELRRRLGAAPPPAYQDPLAPYDQEVVVRHERSQAGLATAAVQQLEQATTTAQAQPTEWPQRAMRLVPRPLARAAVVLLPQGLKDRFRGTADWRIEEQRRAESQRSSQLDKRIAAGEFPELAEPRVSVVIPCFNQGEFLDAAIRSTFEQTMGSFEVIVVDDGSTDEETIAAIDALDWPRTLVIRQQNRGLSAARNAGIDRARGEFVVPLDADDELEPGFLERLIAALDAAPGAALAACRARLFGDIDAVWVPRPYNPYQLLLSNSLVGCVVLRRDAALAVGGYDESMRNGNEDWELWVRLMEAGWDVAEVREPLFRYRKHGISMSVETEARFELGREEIIDRHPALYAVDRLSASKAEHYPLLSVLLDPGVEPPAIVVEPAAVQLVSVTGALEEAVRQAAGKYVVHWAGVAGADVETILRLADHLESRPDLGAAATGDDAPLVVVRRWSLLDPGGPAETATVGVAGSASERLAPGMFPDPDWTVPATIDGTPVQRQRPEEDGRLPTWVST